MKKRHAVFGILVSVAFAGSLAFVYHNALARYVWVWGRMDAVALALNTSPRLPMEIGAYYFGKGAYDLDKAQRAFEHAVKLRRVPPFAHFQLGRIHFIRGELDFALRELEKELELFPTSVRTHYVMGLVWGYHESPASLKEAERHFQIFVDNFPDEWAGYNDLAWIQVRLEKFEEAKRTIERGFEAVPWTRDSNPWMWTMLGATELNMGNYTASRGSFLRAQALAQDMTPQFFWSAYPGNDPRSADTAYGQFQASLSFNLGKVYEELEDTERAISEYRAYLAIPFEENSELPSKTTVERKIEKLNAQN